MNNQNNINVNFSSNDVFDIAIFSGLEVPYETQIPSDLKGMDPNQALTQLKTSYEDYKKNLTLNYGEVLKKIEKHLKDFNASETKWGTRKAVASKLSQVARERIENKENKSAWISLFFQKIGQMFRGRGFRTKGEWGLRLVSKLEKTDKKIIENAIFHSNALKKGEALPSTIIKNRKDIINDYSPEKFKKFLKNVFFKRKENSGFFMPKKLMFYDVLNNEKKKLFVEELFKRSDWKNQMNDIMGNSKENMDLFKNDPMISEALLKKEKSK